MMRFARNLALLSAIVATVNAIPQGTETNVLEPCIPIPGTAERWGCSKGDGYYCDWETRLCNAKKSESAACGSNDECVSGLCSTSLCTVATDQSSSTPAVTGEPVPSTGEQNTTTPALEATQSSSNTGLSNTTKLVIVAGGVAGVVCVVGALFVAYRYRKSSSLSYSSGSPAMSEKSSRKFSLPFTRSSRDGSEDDGSDLLTIEEKQKSWSEYGRYPQPVSLASPPPAVRRQQHSDSTGTYDSYAVDEDDTSTLDELEAPQPAYARTNRSSTGSSAPSEKGSEKGSVHIVYRVANPDQAEQAQQNLFKSAKKLHRRDSRKWALAPENGYSSNSSKRSSRASRSNASHENVATEALYIGVDGYGNETDAYSIEQGDPTSPTGGRYKMASVYSEYSTESGALPEIAELPSAPGNGSTNNLQAPPSAAAGSSKRSSLYELHAPIFQTLERSSVVPPVPTVPEEYKQ